METYELIELEVWGNETEGFDINNFFKTGKFIDIVDDNTIIETLKNNGINMDDITIFNYDEYRIELEYSSGEPAFILEKI